MEHRACERAMQSQGPTLADKMLSDLEKINKAVEELRVKGLPMSFVLMYVNKKTRIPTRDIQAIFDALRELNREIQPKPKIA
jgi:hypothetical protein